MGDGDNRDMGKVVSIFTDTNIYILFLSFFLSFFLSLFIYLFNRPCTVISWFFGCSCLVSLVSFCR